jgi:hypothetical protein
MKFKVGELAFYTHMSEKDPGPIEFGPYASLIMKWRRPFYMEEANNVGIIVENYNSSSLFTQKNKNFNTYVWHSQQTGKTWLVFECELTNEEEYARIGSYAISFVSPFGRTKKK